LSSGDFLTGQADLGGGDIALLWIIGKLVATFAHFLNFAAFLSRIVFVGQSTTLGAGFEFYGACATG
jgi:hypothetical protein